MSYESPIKVCINQATKDVEEEILKAVLNVGVSVNKDELIRALAYDRNQYLKGFNDGANAAPKWISVEEQLPEDNQEYITFRRADGAMEVLHHIGNGVFGSCGGLYSVYNITHWMSLPKPPKEEED